MVGRQILALVIGVRVPAPEPSSHVMNIDIKTLKSGFAMPVFGLGTYGMGGKTEHDPENDDEADIQAIQTAIAAGVTHIDTAEIYASNHTEVIVGKAIQGVERSKLFLVSKAMMTHLSYDDILKACEGSLKRLGTDYLDMYLLHRYNPDLPLNRSMAALDRLVSEGMIKSIGVSNFGVAELERAQSYAANKIVSDQVHYNLEFREPEQKGLLKFCQTNDIFLMAWRPVGKGVMVDRPAEILAEMAEQYQKTPAQIAINWLISQPNVITLAKSRSPKHLSDNLGALGWKMSEADIEYLRSNYPDQKSQSTSVPLSS